MDVQLLYFPLQMVIITLPSMGSMSMQYPIILLLFFLKLDLILYIIKIIVGIFTLYFVKLIEAREITDINNFKNIINDKLWKIISNKYNQTIYYEEFILNNYNE
jgi:hypothetical protein